MHCTSTTVPDILFYKGNIPNQHTRKRGPVRKIQYNHPCNWENEMSPRVESPCTPLQNCILLSPCYSKSGRWSFPWMYLHCYYTCKTLYKQYQSVRMVFLNLLFLLNIVKLIQVIHLEMPLVPASTPVAPVSFQPQLQWALWCQLRSPPPGHLSTQAHLFFSLLAPEEQACIGTQPGSSKELMLPS